MNAEMGVHWTGMIAADTGEEIDEAIQEVRSEYHYSDAL